MTTPETAQALERLEQWLREYSTSFATRLYASDFIEHADELATLRAQLAGRDGEAKVLCIGWVFQHEDTGRMTFCENDGVNNAENFSANNPRHVLCGPAYTHPAPAVVSDELIARLRRRYLPTEVPPCRVCGGELSIASIGGGAPTVWACSGNEDDPERPGYVRAKEGRFGRAPKGAPSEFEPDGHYHDSRWEDRRHGGDPDVIKLIAALTEGGSRE